MYDEGNECLGNAFGPRACCGCGWMHHVRGFRELPCIQNRIIYWSRVESQPKTSFPRLCALNRPSRLRTPSRGARAELKPPVLRLSLANTMPGPAFFSFNSPPTLSPPAVQPASMIDLMLHNQVKRKTGVLTSTLRTGNRSGYRAGGRYANSNRWSRAHPR